MPIPKAPVVNLSEAERQGLEKLIKRHPVGQQIALRARIILAAADGQKNVTTQVSEVTKSGKKGVPRKARRKAARAFKPFLRAVER